MRVVYTHDIFSRQTVGGISRYFVELIRHLAEAPIELMVFAGLYANRHLSELEGQAILAGTFQKGRSRRRLFSYLRNQFRQNRYAHSDRPHIAHHTYYSFTRPFPSARLVVTAHDLIPEMFPRQFGWKSRLVSAAKRHTCAKADRILAVSETTKRDLIEHFGMSPEKVDVAYHGTSLSAYRGGEMIKPHPVPYLLYVGARSGYKNCRLLWEAFARSSRLKENLQVVCFGGGAFTHEERTRLERLNVSEFVHQAGGDDRTLARYYQHASALVYPSLYEGFGLPPVEAMGFGCPIVASTGGSIPEIVGPAGAYFDPRDCEMLQYVLETVLFSEAIQERLREEMRRRSPHFCWKQTAKETLACYERAAA